MKWGRKKQPLAPSLYSSPTPCSRPSLISHVFPVSWLSKFKHKNSNSEPKPRKEKPQGKWNTSLSPLNSPKFTGLVSTTGTGNGRFYGLENDNDDAFWRLSFRKDGSEEEEKKSRVGMKSVWYDSNDEVKAPFPSCENCRSKEAQKFNAKDDKREREKRERVLELRRELGNEEKRSTRGVETTPIRTSSRDEKEKLEETTASRTRRKCRFASLKAVRNPSLETIKEVSNSEQSGEVSQERVSFNWRNLKEVKIEKERKSLYVSREQEKRKRTKQSQRKVKAFSPRTVSRVETCKVKALEDMKKAKSKMKMKMKRKEIRTRVQSTTGGLESFAVVKYSYDPQKDFKDSMVEMIMEKKIREPEELEELLACYLTLNSDEYHDVIIKVFRQVWLELGCELKDILFFSD